ncbi:MAG: hypothetical protein LBQ54_16430 [Planctomycetaceae bacterium]|nr:hypothetical protein [Planctomycetaceae bacterium]
MQRHVARSESHKPVRVAHWEACRFTAHRKRLERLSIGSRPRSREATAMEQHVPPLLLVAGIFR